VSGRVIRRVLRALGGVRRAVQGGAETEVLMGGQLALVTGGAVAAAAVWEALSPEAQRAVTVALARLAARALEAARDE
jgi:hypothetical protein